MNENFIEPFYKAILEKQEELIRYIDQHVNVRIIPEQTVEEPKEIPVKDSPITVPCLIGGILVTAAGLIIGKTVLTVGGAIIIVVGGGAYLLNNRKRTSPEPEPIDYQNISNSLFQILRKVNKQISDEWYEFAGNQKNLLKSQIVSLNIDADRRQKMLEGALERSVIDISMTQILSELNTLANHKDIEEYRQYLTSVKERFTSAISKAYEEQRDIYQAVEKSYK